METMRETEPWEEERFGIWRGKMLWALPTGPVFTLTS
jgi:hypothetical protein